MTAFRRILMGLAIINFLFAFFTAAVGLFADGGDTWSRLLISVLHPIAAVAIIVLVFAPRLTIVAVFGIVVILAVNIVSDMTLALLIAAEIVKGDWTLPLLFSVIPTIAFIYAGQLLRVRLQSSDNPNQSSHS